MPVPRYHFNVYDGVSSLDLDGTELPDVQAARVEGIRLAGEILKDDADRIDLGEEWRLEVTDQAGVVLFRMAFLVVEEAAQPESDRCGDEGPL